MKACSPARSSYTPLRGKVVGCAHARKPGSKASISSGRILFIFNGLVGLKDGGELVKIEKAEVSAKKKILFQSTYNGQQSTQHWPDTACQTVIGRRVWAFSTILYQTDLWRKRPLVPGLGKRPAYASRCLPGSRHKRMLASVAFLQTGLGFLKHTISPTVAILCLAATHPHSGQKYTIAHTPSFFGANH